MIYGHLIWHDLYAAVAPPLPLPVSRIQFVLHSFIVAPFQPRVVWCLLVALNNKTWATHICPQTLGSSEGGWCSQRLSESTMTKVIIFNLLV